MDDVPEGRELPGAVETPPRQMRNDVPPGAPKKEKQQVEKRGKLEPKHLRFGPGNNKEGEDGASKEKLYHLLQARIGNTEGTWVQCGKANCGKWRYLGDVADPNEVPEKWYCFMNKDTQYNSCAAAEQDTSEEEFVDTKFFVGSLIWAKLASYPWWPAMIDDDPDSCLYYCNEDPYDDALVVGAMSARQKRGKHWAGLIAKKAQSRDKGADAF